ncbi:methyl-accepting chemotaxis protein [Rapidithrix thailandica]|uniref:Methyl-accepting chemotaxis protein n=1 Tax=Rapidithrix thailandica TaxID=413964 RepID=A0AAW9SA18_9BACT
MKFIQNLSIKAKLIYSMATLLFIAFMGVSLYNYSVSKEEIVSRIVDHELPAHIDKIARTIQNRIQKDLSIADVTANSHFVHQWLKGGQQDTTQILTYLRLINKRLNAFVGYVSERTKLYYSPNGLERRINPTTDSWYFNFRDEQLERALNVDMDYGTGEMMMWVNMKVWDEHKQFIGVLSTGMDLEKTREFILSQQVGEKGEVMMVDHNGAIKIHNNKDLIDVNDELKHGKTLQTIPGLSAIAVELMSENGAVHKYKNKDGDNHIITTRYIPEMDWYLIVDVSQDEMTSAIESLFIKNMVTGILVTVLIVLFIVFFSNRIIFSRLNSLKHVIEDFAEGNLQTSYEEKNRDEVGMLGLAILSMQKRLQKIVTDISESSSRIIHASKEISQSSQQLAEGAQEQAASIEEVSSSMEQMLANIDQNAANAKETESIADKASQNISLVNQSVLETARAMKTIAEEVSVINDISKRTDMLAINAAIEAARAGEYGKGFAVVASEIRSLAENTQKAAHKIEELSQSSVQVAEESNQSLETLIPDVRKTSSLVQGISAASREQSHGAQNVNDAILQLNDVAQRNSSAAEELAVSADIFDHQADSLQKSIAFFSTEKKRSVKNVQTIQSEIQRLTQLLADVSTSNAQEESAAAKKYPAEEAKPQPRKNEGVAIDLSDDFEDEDNQDEGFEKIDDNNE